MEWSRIENASRFLHNGTNPVCQQKACFIIGHRYCSSVLLCSHGSFLRVCLEPARAISYSERTCDLFGGIIRCIHSFCMAGWSTLNDWGYKRPRRPLVNKHSNGNWTISRFIFNSKWAISTALDFHPARYFSPKIEDPCAHVFQTTIPTAYCRSFCPSTAMSNSQPKNESHLGLTLLLMEEIRLTSWGW